MKNIVISCPIAAMSGYGCRSRDIVRTLISNDDYDISIIPRTWGDMPLTGLTAGEDDDILNCIVYEFDSIKKDIDIYIQISLPSEFINRGKFNIGITAGIETTEAPSNWVDGCNKMDLILTSSQHSKDALLNTKNPNSELQTIVKPIEVLFEGINPEIYRLIDNNEKTELSKILDSIKEDFCFLHVGNWLPGAIGYDRKDIGQLINVFVGTFQLLEKSKQPALLLKVNDSGYSISEKYKLEEKIRQCISLNSKFKDNIHLAPSVYLLHSELTDNEINELYNHLKVKAFVSFTHGEGYGRPLLEFTTTGKPVIVSDWSGQRDFLDKNSSILLPGKVDKVPELGVNEFMLKTSSWFTVDYQKAGEILLKVYSKYDELYNLTKNHIKITYENFSLFKMGNLLKHILNKYTKI